MPLAALVAVATLWCAAALADAPPLSLAVTIDDLPWVGPVAPGDSMEAGNRRILAALAEHHVAATGFVVCDRGAEAVLRGWLTAGHTLGNHTSTHRAVDAVTEEVWEQDVVRCQATLDRLASSAADAGGMGGTATAGGEVDGTTPVERARWFRFPYLRTGRTPERREAAHATLARLGLREAPVSVDTSEWALAKPYVDALAAKKAALAASIGEAYVDHMMRAVRRYQGVAEARAGRPIPHVLLLHANALAADHLGELLSRLEAAGARFVPLEVALADPIYGGPDGYAGPVGPSWLLRMAPADLEGWRWDEGQREGLERRFVADDGAPHRIGRTLTAKRVAPATWVVTDKEPWPANSLVADMPDGTLLLVDTPYTPEGTRELLDWAEARFGRRRLLAVNTHFHYDALGGNATLRAAGATVIGSDRTATLLGERFDAMAALVKGALADRPEQAARFDGWRPEPPTQTFPLAEGLTLDLGEPVRVLYPGPAHAPDNVVVHLPQRDVLFGGCMVLAGPRVGNRSDADMDGWPAATRALMALQPKIVIPGHGDRTDRDLLEHTLSLVTAPAP